MSGDRFLGEVGPDAEKSGWLSNGELRAEWERAYRGSGYLVEEPIGSGLWPFGMSESERRSLDASLRAVGGEVVRQAIVEDDAESRSV